MKYAHFVEMRVFSREEDNEELIREKIRMLFPFEKLKITQTTVVGFEDKKIHILSVEAKRNSEINIFLKNLILNLNPEQKKLLTAQMDSRLDDNLHFFIRLDKDRLLDNKYVITDSGNCFHLKISIAAYPSTKENAKKIIQKILDF